MIGIGHGLGNFFGWTFFGATKDTKKHKGHKGEIYGGLETIIILCVLCGSSCSL